MHDQRSKFKYSFCRHLVQIRVVDLLFLQGEFSVWKQIILSTFTSFYHGKICLALRREVAVVSQEISKCKLKSLNFLNLNTSSYFSIVNLLIEVVFFKNGFIIKMLAHLIFPSLASFITDILKKNQNTHHRR